MFGKGSLILVLGAVITFSLYQVKLNRAVLVTSDNFNYHYMKTIAHEASSSAMNYAVNDIWANNTTNASYYIYADACTSFVRVTPVGLDSVKAQVNSWTWSFDNEDPDSRVRLLDSIYAYFSYKTPISEYFWFTHNEGNVYWISGDTCWGPLHTNSVLKTSGSPVFYGKATAFQGINPNPATSSAQFIGGWEIGMEIDIPTDFSPLIAAANAGNGAAAMNTKSKYDEVTTFDFQANGDVIRTVGSNPPDTVAVTDIAPTGVIYSEEDVRVKGVLNGQLTVYSEENIYIDDDIVLADDPMTNPNSTDILGLVAKENVYVTDNAANNADVKIQASIMAATGKFTAQNYSSRPVSGKLDIMGSIVQKDRGPVGTFSWWTGSIVSGFSKRYRYDPRLQNIHAPYFPFIRSLKLVSWWE